MHGHGEYHLRRRHLHGDDGFPLGSGLVFGGMDPAEERMTHRHTSSQTLARRLPGSFPFSLGEILPQYYNSALFKCPVFCQSFDTIFAWDMLAEGRKNGGQTVQDFRGGLGIFFRLLSLTGLGLSSKINDVHTFAG